MKDSFRRRLCSILVLLLGASACGFGEWPSHMAPRASLAASPEGGSSYAPAVASLAGGHFSTSDGARVALQGFSWFGFNTGTGQLDGLWQAAEPLAGDFATVVWRQKLLGFNAVRLPFSFSQLAAPARSVAAACRVLAAGEVGSSTLPAGSTADPSEAPPLPADVNRSPGTCNGYLPTGSQREAYLWVAKFYLDNGFYVLADNHFREDSLAQDDQAAWVGAWANLAQDLYALPGAPGRVFLDILNEPGQRDQVWEAKNGKAGLQALYTAALDAIEAKVPGTPIYFLEGTGQDTLGANWGDGFCTDADKVASLSLSDPRPFFSGLASKPYRGRVALAPHVYGPAVTNATANFKGPGLFARLSDSFGGLNRTGFPLAGQPSLLFPVAIGEFGSKFETDDDKAFMSDFSLYLRAKDAGDDGRHAPLENWFYWSWNADSGDTGGLVKDDWKELQWQKIDYLTSLGLTPWWQKTGPTTAPPSGANTSAPKPSGTSPMPPAASAASAPAAPDASANAPAGHSTATSPQSAPAADPAVWGPLPAPQSPHDGDISVLVHKDASWAVGLKRCFSVNLHISRPSGRTIEPPWSLEVDGPNFNAVTNAWNLHRVGAVGNTMKAVADGDWQHLGTALGEVVVGLTYCVDVGQPESVTGVRVAGIQARLQ